MPSWHENTVIPKDKAAQNSLISGDLGPVTGDLGPVTGDLGPVTGDLGPIPIPIIGIYLTIFSRYHTDI
jgi:hypothetical protein